MKSGRSYIPSNTLTHFSVTFTAFTLPVHIMLQFFCIFLVYSTSHVLYPFCPLFSLLFLQIAWYIFLLSFFAMAVSLTLRITRAGRADGPAECLLLANIEDLESQQIMRAQCEQWGLCVIAAFPLLLQHTLFLVLFSSLGLDHQIRFFLSLEVRVKWHQI